MAASSGAIGIARGFNLQRRMFDLEMLVEHRIDSLPEHRVIRAFLNDLLLQPIQASGLLPGLFPLDTSRRSHVGDDSGW